MGMGTGIEIPSPRQLWKFQWMILTDVGGRCVGGGPGGPAGIVEFRRRSTPAAAAAAAAVTARTVVAASAVVIVVRRGRRLPRRIAAQRCHVTRRTAVLHTTRPTSTSIRTGRNGSNRRPNSGRINCR